MTQLLSFIASHWWLAAIFVFLGILVIQVELSSNMHGIKMVSPQEVIMLINKGEGIIIDIRNLDAYNKGHIVNSLSYPEKDIFEHIKLLQNKYSNKMLIIVCNNGQQSPKVGASLKKKYKFEKICGLKGGLNTWLTENLPVVKNEGSYGATD